MKIIERGDTWFLYGEENSFFISALCSHGPADYEFIIELSVEEIEKYKIWGAEYLNKLSYEIHYSAPGVIGSNSIYKSRKVANQYIEKITKLHV